MTEPNAHTLTIKFHRFLSEDEWRTIVQTIRFHVREAVDLQANSVTESDEELQRVDFWERRELP